MDSLMCNCTSKLVLRTPRNDERSTGSASVHIGASKILPAAEAASGVTRLPCCVRKPSLPRCGKYEKETLMKMIAASAFAMGLGLLTVSAQAMPIAPVDKPVSNEITRVAQGCGAGMHRGPAGACRPLFTCPPGWHTGPYGKKCFRN
jgi:hypothetical protein